MGKKVRIDRKKLKQPDEFQSTAAKVIEWAAARRQILIYILIAGVAAAAVTNLIGVYKRNAARKASVMLYQAVRSYGEQATATDLEQALAEFQELADKYPRSSAAGAARLYIGHIYDRLGENERALESYQKALGSMAKDDYMRETTLLDVGHVYQAMGEHMKAAEVFRGAAESEKAVMGDYAYFLLGLNLQLAGHMEEADSAFQKLMDKYPGSPWSQQAKWRMNIEGGTINTP